MAERFEMTDSMNITQGYIGTDGWDIQLEWRMIGYIPKHLLFGELTQLHPSHGTKRIRRDQAAG